MVANRHGIQSCGKYSEGKGEVSPIHTMMARREIGGIAPLILNLGTRLTNPIFKTSKLGHLITFR
jgi:hypothetical protein